MTEKTLIKKIKALGGTITQSKCVDFPDIRINNRQEAQDVLEILRYANELQDTEKEYSCSLDEPLDALIAWLKNGYGNEIIGKQESEDIEKTEPLHLFDIPLAGLHDLFRDFDLAMEERKMRVCA
jgi:hypothetical protein